MIVVADEDLLTILNYSMNTDGARLFSQMSGITCYYEDNTVNAIVAKDGTAVYACGQWKEEQ